MQGAACSPLGPRLKFLLPQIFSRVWLRSSIGIAGLSQHDPDGCQAQESERLAVEAFPILGEAAAAVGLADDAFDNPAFGQHRQAFVHTGAGK